MLNILITKTPHTAILREFWVALYSNQQGWVFNPLTPRSD